MLKILVIDDEKDIRHLLMRLLEREHYEVIGAAGAEEGWRMLGQEEVGVVLTDIRLKDGNGVELTARIRKEYPATEVICLTAYGTIGDGVRAIKNGAFDYLVKLDDNDKIIPLVAKAMEKANLQAKISRLQEKMQQGYQFDQIIGEAPALQQAIQLARQVAPTEATVLLSGETGSGKEVFARSIHAASPRRLESLVAVNCSALGRELLESELFGYRAGAFTGATRDKKGLFEEAHRGTLFLDEIGEMEPGLQAKLLRVLENGSFIKIGETKERQVDVRVIAATNRDLEQEVAAGNFRQDLFYRLSVFQIRLPGLNERSEDIPILAEYFARYFSLKLSKGVNSLHPHFVTALRQHIWKGNVRELRNVMERAVILASRPELTPDLLPFHPAPPAASEAGYSPDLSLAEVEKRHIQLVLNHSKGNKTQAARILNIGLTTLYAKIRQYGLEEI